MHLIPFDDFINTKPQSVNKNDLIYLKGFLVDISKGFDTRKTSTTRYDTGAGACETVLVTDLKFIKDPSSP